MYKRSNQFLHEAVNVNALCDPQCAAGLTCDTTTHEYTDSLKGLGVDEIYLHYRGFDTGYSDDEGETWQKTSYHSAADPAAQSMQQWLFVSPVTACLVAV